MRTSDRLRIGVSASPQNKTVTTNAVVIDYHVGHSEHGPFIPNPIFLGVSQTYLSDEIGSDISGLGVDSTSDTSKHGNAGSSESVSGDALGEVQPVSRGGVVGAVGKHGEVQDELSKTTEGESHDGSGTEGGVEARSPASLLGRDGSTDVGVDSDLHSEVSAEHRRERSHDKGKGREETTGKVPAGSPRDEEEDDEREQDDKDEAHGVLGTEERLGSLVDGLVNLVQTRCGGIVVTASGEGARLGRGLRLDGDPSNDQELDHGPEKGDNARNDNDSTGRDLSLVGLQKRQACQCMGVESKAQRGVRGRGVRE